MKLDKFTIFACYSAEEQDLLNRYLTTNEYECSSFKGIPIALYKRITKLLPNKKRRIRFRGKSRNGYNRPRDYVHKDFAETFAIYYD
jgi:hypothetical protein